MYYHLCFDFDFYKKLWSSFLDVLCNISINVINHRYSFYKCYLLSFYICYLEATPNM